MGSSVEVAVPAGARAPAAVAEGEGNQDALTRMLLSQVSGVDVPAEQIAEHVRVLGYRARLLVQIQATSPGMVNRQMGPGFSRNGLLNFLLGKSRAATVAYVIARMNALGWTP